MDALNGILGILHACSRGSHPEYHFHGLPLANHSLDGKFPKQLLQNLGWDHLTNSVISPSTRPPKRRPSFPSWCWTGWDTEIRFPTVDPEDVNNEVNVSFETVHGQILSWEDGLAIIKGDNAKVLSTTLHLDVWTFQTTFTIDDNYRIWPNTRSRRRLNLTANLDQGLRQRLQIESWTCIILHWADRMLAMVVDRQGGVCYRIGLLTLMTSLVDTSELVKRRIKLV